MKNWIYYHKKIDTFFTAKLIESGTIPLSAADTTVQFVPEYPDFYIIAMKCRGIPEMAIYLVSSAGGGVWINLLSGNSVYCNVTSTSPVNILLHSNQNSPIEYVIYKLPY